MERKEMLERIKEIKEERYCGTEQAFLYLKSLESAKDTMEKLISSVNKRLGENGSIEYPANEKNILCLLEGCQNIFLEKYFIERLPNSALSYSADFFSFLDSNNDKTFFLYAAPNALPNERDKISSQNLQEMINDLSFPDYDGTVDETKSFSEWKEFFEEIFISSQKCDGEETREEYLAVNAIRKILSCARKQKGFSQRVVENALLKTITYDWEEAFSNDRFNVIEKSFRDLIFYRSFNTKYQILRVLNDGEDGKFEVRRKILGDFFYSQKSFRLEIKSYEQAEELMTQRIQRSYKYLKQAREIELKDTSDREIALLTDQTLQRFLRNEKNWVKNYLKN